MLLGPLPRVEGAASSTAAVVAVGVVCLLDLSDEGTFTGLVLALGGAVCGGRIKG